MKCPKCGLDNSSGATYCKSCGTALQQKYNTCKNGHNYDATLAACPFCPSAGSLSGAKTQIDGAGGRGDKTIVDMGGPKLMPHTPSQGSNRDDKTMIYGPNQGTNNAPAAGIRKLVGWLVTYDINPAGIDYKLYIGRHKIGRSSNSDIVIQQPGISEDHAVLLYRDDKFILQDMLSTNGTYVNEELIDDKVTLKNDDIIRIGDIKLKLKIV